jgi:hypothetical protein
MSSCEFHVVLYLYSGINATSTLLWDYAAMKAVWDHTRSFLRHHCQRSFALTGACDIIIVLRHHCRSLRHSCQLVGHHSRFLFAPTGACDFIAVLIFIVAYPLLWSSCSSSWDQTIIYCARLCVLSCGIIAGLNRRLVGRLAALMAGLNRRLIERLAASPPS